METSYNQSTLEMLPDEILLEVCKYLLCSDILHSFIGLNYRMTQMISQYRHHVSLHKTSISKFHYLCTNILPQIGSQIRTIVIDCSYSLLQDHLFMEYFGKRMSKIFPKLERISHFSSYEEEQLLLFLSTLHGLDHLVEIRLYNLCSIERSRQQIVARSLFQANNHRFATIFMDSISSPLSFDNSDCYLNVLRLTIKLETVKDLSSLFTAVPNVWYLDVLIEGIDPVSENFDEMKLSSLVHLIDFRLQCINRMWQLEELFILSVQLPIVRYLSLFLSTCDRRLIDGNVILPSLSSTVQQFNYAIYFFPDVTFDPDDAITASWPSSHPVAFCFNDEFLFIHTLPWYFTRISYFSIVNKMVTCHSNNEMGYDKQQVEELDLWINGKFTFSKSLSAIPQCRRVRKFVIHVKNDVSDVKEGKPSIPCCSKLSRLHEVSFYGPIPSDLNHFSLVLNAAPNLFRLDLPFNYLLRFFEDQQICHLLDRRITSLSIFANDPGSSSVRLNEEHIPVIASAFSRLCDLFVNFAHLPFNTAIVSKEDSPDDLLEQNVSTQSCEQKYEVISPGSSESMLLCLLTKFKERRFLSLCIDAKFIEEIKTDTEQWLRNNTILREQQFKAVYYKKVNQLLIWM